MSANRPQRTEGTTHITISTVEKLGSGRYSHFEVVKILRARDMYLLVVNENL